MKTKIEARKLQELYDQIPTFKCKDSCSDCCGPVATTRLEQMRAPKLATHLDRLQAHLASNVINNVIGNGCLDCPYSTPLGCEVYADRPFLCRLFGTVPELACPHGCGPTKPGVE
jgi:Fe-S-cluster containining protein